jgi:Tol biopolymer transport system component
MHWSTDSRSLLASSIAAQSQAGQSAQRLYRIDAQTGETSEVATAQGVDPQSVDGSTLFFMRTGWPKSPVDAGWTLMAQSLPTGAEREIFRDNPPGHMSMRLSSDGQRIAVLSRRSPGERLLVMSESGQDLREVFQPAGGRPILDFALSADGRYVIFSTSNKQAGDWELWRAPVEGGALGKIALTMPRMRLFSMHPDGKRLAFASTDSRPAELWLLENVLPAPKPRSKPPVR